MDHKEPVALSGKLQVLKFLKFITKVRSLLSWFLARTTKLVDRGHWFFRNI